MSCEGQGQVVFCSSGSSKPIISMTTVAFFSSSLMLVRSRCLLGSFARGFARHTTSRMSYFSCDVNLVTVSFRNRQLGKARKEVRHGNRRAVRLHSVLCCLRMQQTSHWLIGAHIISEHRAKMATLIDIPIPVGNRRSFSATDWAAGMDPSFCQAGEIQISCTEYLESRRDFPTNAANYSSTRIKTRFVPPDSDARSSPSQFL
jgi:hypothetical protein